MTSAATSTTSGGHRARSSAADGTRAAGVTESGTNAAHSPPLVSVVIPMLDELDWIEECIDSFRHQDHPLDRLQVLVVDGGSTDGSRELVAELEQANEWLQVIDNPDRLASSAFNRGIEAANGEVVCLVGAHASVGPDFVSRSVAVLTETGAGGVGGQLLHEGTDPVQQAIGLAMTSRFGMASPFRYSTERCEVDTIGHPAYRRDVLEEVGPFDESLLRNSDYELNHRIRAAGHTLVLDPTIVTLYRPRATLRALARQFYDYGLGKADVARNHPDSLKLRHAAAPAAALLIGAAPILSLFRSGRRLLTASALFYAAVLATAVVTSRPGQNRADGATFVAAFPIMHVTWGTGFLVGLVTRR